jgi:hypothetical protein
MVLAGTQDGERLIRRIDFKNLIAVQPQHANVQRTRRKFDLRRSIVEVEERHSSLTIQANR